jgi:hypothetical protein
VDGRKEGEWDCGGSVIRRQRKVILEEYKVKNKWRASGRQGEDQWKTSGRQVEDKWKTSGRQAEGQKKGGGGMCVKKWKG